MSGHWSLSEPILDSHMRAYKLIFSIFLSSNRFDISAVCAVSYVGIKDFVPPYLDPSLSIDELITGVSFASAGSGFDPLTPAYSVRSSWIWLSTYLWSRRKKALWLYPSICICRCQHILEFDFVSLLDVRLSREKKNDARQTLTLVNLQNVISLPRQLEYFQEYKQRLEAAIGKEQTERHVKKAVFLISAGTNDFVVNYFTVPIRRKSFTVSSYQQFVLQKVREFIQVGVNKQSMAWLRYPSLQSQVLKQEYPFSIFIYF